MEIIETKELKEVTTQKFVAYDGKTFDNKQDCLKHERLLSDQTEKYFCDNAIEIFDECYEGLGAFLGGYGGLKVFLIRVDEFVQEHMEDKGIDEDLGSIVALAVEGFGAYDSWYLQYTLDGLIADLEGDLLWLKSYK